MFRYTFAAKFILHFTYAVYNIICTSVGNIRFGFNLINQFAFVSMLLSPHPHPSLSDYIRNTKDKYNHTALLTGRGSVLEAFSPATSLRLKRSNLKLLDRYSSLSSMRLRLRHRRRVIMFELFDLRVYVCEMMKIH